jgi:hypothetical protein
MANRPTKIDEDDQAQCRSPVVDPGRLMQPTPAVFSPDLTLWPNLEAEDTGASGILARLEQDLNYGTLVWSDTGGFPGGEHPSDERVPDDFAVPVVLVTLRSGGDPACAERGLDDVELDGRRAAVPA